MADFIRIASTDDIPVGSFKAFEVKYEPILVVHSKDGFYALANECSHDAAPISDGKLMQDEIVCARHGARFDIKSGAVTRSPAVVPIDTYEVKLDGGDIFIRVAD